jgi:cytochrome c biogenesis protein
VDQATFLSQGATKIDPPGVTDEAQRRRSQIAITGLFAPTSTGGSLITSTYPALNNPQAAVDVYRGDLGLDSGRGQSIFAIDQKMVEQGRLVRVARENLVPGQSLTLDDGTRVTFDRVEEWVNLQVSHDPAQEAVLIAAVALLAGITASLVIKRRRFWVRIAPTAPSTTDGRRVPSSSTVEFGGLARTDQAGYGEEFTRLVRDLAGPDAGPVRDPGSASGAGPARDAGSVSGPARDAGSDAGPDPVTGTPPDDGPRADGEDHHGR